MEGKRYRTLGGNVIPENYNITFDTDLKTFKFAGNEKIRVKIKKATKRISLNAVDLKIISAKVTSKRGVHDAKVGGNKKRKEITLKLQKAVAGDATIGIEFVGINNDKMYGFYRSRYMENGKERYLLTSQFEAADARTAFPCFDEPAFKATYDIAMIIDNDFDAVSNMPIKSVARYEKERKVVTFKTTPRMSSYLLYLGVGRFESVTGSLGKLKLRVMTVPGKKKLARLPLKYAKQFIKFFNGYFGIDYPLPKADFLAIPDFSAGAMENWGAITFREIALLGDEKSTPIAMQQQIAETVAHELAHQWFGDLVTMQWWNDLWLNESFATFMANKALDAVYPEWDMKKQYFDDVISAAFSADALKSTHPISVHVSTPEEIDQIFDAISYEKGGTVLHMLENYAGEEPFRRGLHAYLKKHAYGNATKYDLWKAVDSQASKGSKNIMKFASNWINNPGYPIVEVSRSGSNFNLKQRRFLIVDYKNQTNERWPIPLDYTLDGKKTMQTVLDGQQTTVRAGNAKWIKLNYGQHYLYRVRYPQENLEKVGVMIKSGKLKGADSWGIENDLFVLARSGKIKADEYLDFVESYCMNTDYPLSFNVSSHLGWLKNMFDGKGPSARLRRISTAYHQKVLGKLGWRKRSGEDSIKTMFRSIAISSLGQLEHKQTVSRALSIFNGYLKGKKIEPNIKGAIYGIAAWTGNMARYRKMVALYKREEIPDDKRRLLQSLAMFRDREIIGDALKFAFSKDVRLQDSFILPAIISSNPVGRTIIWPWTRSNWKRLMKTYDSGTHMLERFVVNLSSASDPGQRREIEAFFGKRGNMRGDIRLRTKQTLEKIEANINFMKANGIGKD